MKGYEIVWEKVCVCVLSYLTVNGEFVSVSEKERGLSIGGPAEACGEYACVREWLYIQWPSDGFWNAFECVLGLMLFSARRCLCQRVLVCVCVSSRWVQCVESGSSAVLWLVGDEDDEEKDSVEPHSAALQDPLGSPLGAWLAREITSPPFTLLHIRQRICTHRPPLITGARSSCSVCVQGFKQAAFSEEHM